MCVELEQNVLKILIVHYFIAWRWSFLLLEKCIADISGYNIGTASKALWYLIYMFYSGRGLEHELIVIEYKM